MLNVPEGVEIKCNYNCFENNTEVLDEIKKIYEFCLERKYFSKDSDKDYDFISICLKLMGNEIIFENIRDKYQGDVYIIFWHRGEVILYETSYGSCEICDIWQGGDFLENLYYEAKNAISFPNIYEMVKYLLCADFYDESIKDFGCKQAKDLIENKEKIWRDRPTIYEQLKQIEICLKEKEE